MLLFLRFFIVLFIRRSLLMGLEISLFLLFGHLLTLPHDISVAKVLLSKIVVLGVVERVRLSIFFSGVLAVTLHILCKGHRLRGHSTLSSVYFIPAHLLRVKSLIVVVL